MKGYTNQTAIENYLLITIDESFAAQIVEWIGQMETLIDRETGRNFVADATATERKFDGDGSTKLLIDDAFAITELTIDDQVIDVGDYFAYPNVPPYTRIEGPYFSRAARQNVIVEAKWGYSAAAPADIKFAATVLVAGIINYSWKADGQIKSKTIGRYSVTYKDEQQWQDFARVSDILAGYKKYNM